MTKAELTELRTKADILENAGYRSNFDREMYVNRKAKKAFSMSFLEDRTLTDVERCVSAPVDEAAWQFYFIENPSPSVRHQLEHLLS